MQPTHGSTLTLALLVIAGCSGGALPASKAPRDAREARFIAFTCDPKARPDEEGVAAAKREARFQGRALSPAVTSDYVGLRRRGLRFPEAERGVVCGGAHDRRACQERFDALIGSPAPIDSIQRRVYDTPYLITTRGDDVKLWSPARFAEALGPIDTPLEAWLLMRTIRDMPIPTCGDAESAAYRSVPAGYEIRFRYATQGCRPFEVSEVLLRVGAEGDVRLLLDRVASSDPERCIVD